MSMEFEPRTSYLDMDTSSYLLGDTMEYLQYDQTPSSPSFGASLNLAGTSGSPAMDFHTLNLSPSLGEAFYNTSAYGSNSNGRSFTPAIDGASISPPMLSYNLSAGEVSSDESHTGRRSRGAPSTPPPSVPYAATIPRSHRYNPIAVPATRSSARAAAHKRRSSKSSNDPDHDSDAEEEEEYQHSSGSLDPRRELVRKQRIESEQRRRDELRDGYARLKAVLPPSTAKSSKVSLLDRAAHHLKHLEACKTTAESRVQQMEAELKRVREINEMLSIRAVQQREANHGGFVGQSTGF